MKVAIIGAGVSGLAAAITFQRYGITPDIFEKKCKIGELFNHVAGLLKVINRPIKDPLHHLKNVYGIEVKPINTIDKIVMKGPTVTASVTGSNLGYMILRGQDANSLENQLYNKLEIPVNFNIEADYKKLKNNYDYVIIATGSSQIPKELGCWQELVTTWVRVANVLGNFDTKTLIMLINTLYTKSGYVYLIPYNEKRAVLAMVIPYISKEELQYYWDTFLKVEKMNVDIVNMVDLQHTSGNCFPHQYENLLFVGNAGGAIEPFLGFGTFNSIMSGAIAAKSIAEGIDFEKEISFLSNANIKMLEFRKALDLMDNDKLDKFIKILTFPPVKKLVYNTNFNAIKYGSLFMEYTVNKLHNKPYEHRKRV
ncbi:MULTISPECIES: NAD(P)/FAD-dependent oxidoreductase [Thermoanaerobacter]|uniref:Dehydrogenase (Flavoprotein)-like protein n=3 Tax=Thermoanaerobacter TaxID=1754 RepID=B0KDA2_THEP3|nr:MULTISPECIES: FAD-dependent oxidoreductase [Thermoanaerobacter]EGD51144.1 FAD dependent oxidoreductase [Thermoanaerobacter ethanolicus JW 200]ABY95621.1 Dehydrogenase (flavoprotein)-like protein [Thermoanaerobacter pseudethanolicus ATCC 33223]ADV80559.1 FAD dependent oxidoreductase [Thermoanaerobacter brockii subsp. finnii Ako-1]EIV99332.1 flavin-dependent dehydrogenase [Thermoanaerobacter siderophilus SR4]HBW60286.1 dehydrogenase [Thermoanaerobacter sp.]